ncbi:dihydrofolate reductase [uncultured Mediterranean phage]|nr:dihydrofolate reductase [uncultured Mediterranean phage]
MIAVVYRNGGMGMKKTIPFQYNGMDKIKDYFDKYTIGRGNNSIIIGKNTEQQLPTLPKRQPLILSKTLNNKNTFETLAEAKKKGETYDELWIVGGEKTFNSCIYDQALKHILITEIDKDIMSNCFFPEIPLCFKLAAESRHTNNYFTYKQKIYMRNDDKYFTNL